MSDEANLPVIPDKVAEKLRDGKDVPLEEISSAAAEMKDTREASRSVPLRGETLRPVSRAQANTLMTGNPEGLLQRGSVPRAPVTRRVIPPPFRRESISIRVPGEPQPQWHNLKASQVREGYIVPGVGRVVSIRTGVRYAEAGEMVPVTLHTGEAAEVKAVLLDGYTEADYHSLVEEFGSEQVAVGTDIVLTGPEGGSITVDAEAEVQAFGL